MFVVVLSPAVPSSLAVMSIRPFGTRSAAAGAWSTVPLTAKLRGSLIPWPIPWPFPPTEWDGDDGVLVVMMVAFLRGASIEEAAFESQCGVIGNVGFLGVPMLTLLMGEAAIGSVMLVLSIDLIVFGSLVVVLVTGSRDGAVGLGALKTVGLGLLKNPMIVSIVLGLGWSALKLPIPGVMNDFLSLLGGAATPGALFAIGASLATKKAERPVIAGWLSFSKLVLHPGAVAFSALLLFPVEPYAAAVMIAAAALPVAGNVYILAEHYRIAPQRVSASILISTAIAVITVSVVIGWVSRLYQ